MQRASNNNLLVLLALASVGMSSVAIWNSFRNGQRSETALESAAQPVPKLPVDTVETTQKARVATPALPASASDQPRPTVILPVQDAAASKSELELEAEYTANRLLERMPNSARAMHVSAMRQAQLHNTEEAVKLWTKCIELDPKTEQYYVNLAAAAIDRGQSNLALSTLEQAVANGLRSSDVLHHLSISLLNTGRVEEAAKIATETLQNQPRSAAHWLILGQAQLKLGQLSEAEASLLKAIELGVHSKAAYFSLFNVCVRLGKQDDASKYREIYASFSEKKLDVTERFNILSEAEARRLDISVLLEACALYIAAGQHRDAEHQLLRVLAIESDNRAACQELASLYVREGRMADERVVRERLIKLDPNNLMNYLFAAKACAASGDMAQAEAYIKLAISLAPRTISGYAAMAEFLIEKKQPSRAVWYLQQALEIEPSAEGFKLLAQTQRALGNISEAEAAEAALRQLADEPFVPKSNQK